MKELVRNSYNFKAIFFALFILLGACALPVLAAPLIYEDADRLIREKEFDRAESLLKSYLSSNDNDVIAISMMGRLYQEMGDRKRAARFLDKAIKISPNYPTAHFFQGKNCYMALKNDEAVSEFAVFRAKMEGLSNLTRVDELFYINALEEIGEVYFNLKMYEEFYAVTQKILKIFPDNQTALYNVGVYQYVYNRSNSEAYRFFNKVIDQAPDSYLAKKARYAIEFIRANPDPRIAPDFDFIDRL